MFVVEVFKLSWPVLGTMLALWAHLGAYVGAFWTKKRFQNTLDQKKPKKKKKKKKKKRTKNGPKTLSPAACWAPRSAPGSPGGPKNGPFLATLKTSVFDVPKCSKTQRKEHTKPVSCCHQREIAFFGPTLAHRSPILAHLGGHVGPSWRLRWGHVGPFWPKRPKREKRSKTRVLSICDGPFGHGHVQGPWPDFRADAPQPARDPTNGEGKGN